MTAIEWTEKTWNPIAGCSLVSPGCTNCYAMRMAARLEAMATADNARRTDPHHGGKTFDSSLGHYVGLTKSSKAGPVWTGKVALAPERTLLEPLRRKKPTMYFVNSMADLFHEDVPDGWIMHVLKVIFETPRHTYQILTKRSHRMRDFMRRWNDLSGEDFEPKLVRGPDETRKAHPSGRGQLFAAYLDTLLEMSGGQIPPGAAWPTFDWAEGMIGWPNYPANLWLGVSCEDQRRADERIPDLLATPAAVRFVSAEPLLGDIEFQVPHRKTEAGLTININALTGEDGTGTRHAKLDWVIVGGESGPGARPMHPDWARSIRDQCSAAGVPFFFKQWGAWAPGEHIERRSGSVDVAYSDGDEPWAFGIERLDFDGGHIDDEPTLYRIGKREAGRLLDGREWNEMPSPAREAAE